MGPRGRVPGGRRVNSQQRSHRNAKLRRTLLRAFVWFVLLAFVSTIVGAGLITLGLH
jgi:hypothetical protein